MATLAWELRSALPYLREEGRLAVLMALVLHTNIRMRCWPSTHTLTKETGWNSASVTKAKKWLQEHGAFALVPFAKRLDEEEALPRRQHVYQMTGILRIEGRIICYLYLTPEARAAIEAAVGKVSVSETSPSEISPIETSAGETKGVPHQRNYRNQGVTSDQVSAATAAGAIVSIENNGQQHSPDKKVAKSAKPSIRKPQISEPKQSAPHIDIIDAYHNALPEGIRPVGGPNIRRNVRIAAKLHDAGITPAQITQFVQERYSSYFDWATKRGVSPVMPLEHVATHIKAFLSIKAAQNGKPSEADGSQRERQIAEKYGIDL